MRKHAYGHLFAFRLLVGLVLSATLSSRAYAQNRDFLAQDSPSKTWVYIELVKDEPQWQAKALEEFITSELSHSTRVSIVRNLAPQDSACKSGETPCLLRYARNHRIDIFILGKLMPTKFVLQSYEVATHSLVTDQDIQISENSRSEDFRHQIYKSIKPFFQIGGLFDRSKMQNRDSPFKETLKYFLSGLLWALAFIVFRNVLLRCEKMDQISSDALFRVLDSWVMLNLGKIFLYLTVFIPFGVALFTASHLHILDAEKTRLFALPFSIVIAGLIFPACIKQFDKFRYFQPLTKTIEENFPDSRVGKNKQQRLHGIMIALGVIIMTLFIRNSVQYHGVYIERMAQLKKKIENQKKRLDLERISVGK